MRRAGDGTETTVGKLSYAGCFPHDRGFVLGLPRSKDRASTGRPITGHEGSPPRSAPNPVLQAGSRCRWSWRLQALAGVVARAIVQMKPAISRAMAVMTATTGISGRNQMAVALAHPELSFPGDVAGRLRQRLQPGKELRADAGLHAVTPGAFDQCAPGKTAARLGDPAPPDTCAAGVL